MRTERPRLAMALLCLFVLAGCAGPSPQPVTRWEGEAARITLSYRHDARAVFAAGDFNGWEPERHPFRRGEDGRWSLELSLPPGEHAYLLAIETDDSWEWRPDASRVRSGLAGSGRSLAR